MITTLLPNISSSMWSMSVANYGAVVTDLEDIKQCVLIILSTNKGSDPFRPDFGFNIGELLDKPVNYVIPNGKLGIVDALTNYEPRVKVTRIVHTLDIGHVTFYVYCATNIANFVVSMPISPNYIPTALGAFSSGFDSGFDI